MPRRPTYLKTLWKEKRIYFWLMIVLALGNLLSAIISAQVLTPFYVYGMYTMPEPSHDTIPVYQLVYNDGKVFHEPHTYLDYRRMMYTYSVLYYDQLKTGSDTLHKTGLLNSRAGQALFPPAYRKDLRPSSREFNDYPLWLCRYIGQATGEDIYRLAVLKTNTHFVPGGHLIVLNQEVLLSTP